LGNRFRTSLLDRGTFSVTWELVPGRGAREKAQGKCLADAERAAQGGRLHAVTITDNPGGNPAIQAAALAGEILGTGIEPLLHLTCKDRNRNQLEGDLYALDRAGVKNLLVMSGDYPVGGWQGRSAPVFDLDPVQALGMIAAMNGGFEVPGLKGPIRHRPSDFFAGVAVSPFKATEAEQLAQYYKLDRKIAAGASFVVTQLGYDARKFHEIRQLMTSRYPGVPLVGNVYVLPYGAARLMHRNGVPGCVVTDKLLAELDRERQAADKGERARLQRAARLYAILKGMGYDGVHIGGHNLSYEQVESVIDEGEALASEWSDLLRHFDDPQPEGFYLYERDPRTRLNGERLRERKGRPSDAPVAWSYPFSRAMHRWLFEPQAPLFKLMRRICGAVEGSAGEGFFHKLEHLFKVLLFDCHDCGDCALMDVAYLCPMSRCPKHQRNGACGGSRDGWCEVYPGTRRCIYVLAYTRLKTHGAEELLGEGVVPPCHWDLYQHSSWINFYLGRDHAARRMGIPEVPKGKKN